MPTNLETWNAIRVQYISILRSQPLTDLITYSNEQSRFKSQSRYGILYPFLRIFGFADEFKTTDGETANPIEFGAKYSVEFHKERIGKFEKQVAQTNKDVNTHLYYNTYRSYTSGLELNSWIQNNQGARGYIDKDKLEYLPKISKLVEPFESLRLKLFDLSKVVYTIDPLTTAFSVETVGHILQLKY